MPPLPFDDWQFYIVTLAAIGGLWMLKRTLWPARKGKRGCTSCDPAGGNKTKGDRVKLTVEGQRKGR